MLPGPEIRTRELGLGRRIGLLKAGTFPWTLGNEWGLSGEEDKQSRFGREENGA